MIKTAILEDDPFIADFLEETLYQIDPAISVIAKLESVEESINFFSTGVKLDLIFCDVQLRDGISFTLFESVDVNVPIIFVTGYDSFVLQALEKNGIEYLLKPVLQEDLLRAVNKYKKLELHFTGSTTENSLQILKELNQKQKTRMLVKKGIEHIPILLTEIVFFFTENKVVFAVDTAGKRSLVDKNLNELEEELGGQGFFRANRQYLLNIDYIKSFKPYERVKLWVELTANNIDYTIVVSQQTSSSFRKWLERS